MEEVRALQNRITELEKENAYLKSLLNKAGISYSAKIFETNCVVLQKTRS